jgi:chromosome segregation ATPase
MDNNDKDIAEKRRELDKLKKYYETTKEEHKTQEDALKKEIDEIRNANKKTETKRTKQKTELETLQQENQKLEKQIRDMNNDKMEKEETIKDKNELKRKLDKDNQELEKFKYVLHYKIKELKHNKEPKERKIQQMEKKAKDMEREIKSCELGQSTIIIELSTNHQIIKIHEDQISKTEKRIESLRNYKKIFQENLYNSMKRARNHKDCKRELVLLKRNFLDKEKVDKIVKPFESNYELQREFLEKNVDHIKNKISKMNDLFVNDHNKVMKEKRQLIEIVNQLEKEKKEIKENDTNEKISSITKPKTKLKSDVPRFPHPKKKKGDEDDEEEEDENTLKELADELKAVEKEIQWCKYLERKQEKEKEKEKKEDN